MNTEFVRYRCYHFPAEIIRHAAWLYLRFTLNFRDAEELLASRGVLVSNETIRQWCLKFGPTCANTQRLRQSKRGDKVPLDEVYQMSNGTIHYL